MVIELIGDWGNDSSKEAQHIANAVYTIFSEFVGEKLSSKIIVYNDATANYPLAHYEKENGCYMVRLSCKTGQYWSQIAYQLSHEICHLYCNHSSSRDHKHKWLEESFCEAASIAVMIKLAANWNKYKISEINPAYGNSIEEYINNVIGSVECSFDEHELFAAWLVNNLSNLEKSSIQRNLNRVVALHIYNAVLKTSPNYWKAIRSLNKWNCHANIKFDDFLNSWVDCDIDHSVKYMADFLRV